MDKIKETKRCYIDIHVLQTVPPSCVNRDDTGSPKIATYGGVTRARVSSQAWKRAVRQYFETFGIENIGLRSKLIVGEIAKVIRELDPDVDCKKAEKKAKEALKKAREALKKDNKAEKKASEKTKEDDSSTDVLLFISCEQIKALAKLSVDGEEDQKEYKKAIKDHPAIDMALFGRMMASDPSLNYCASVQVAHAISTHAVQNEFDYFTAVDDLSPENNSGAGHIGTAEFNSATLYRYATINVDELAKLIPAEVEKAVKAFVEAFCKSMPTGKQNSFANNTFPDMVYIAVRGDQPVSLVGAFEKPIKATGEGYVDASERALIKYAKNAYQLFVSKPELSLGCSLGENGLNDIAELKNITEIIEEIGEVVTKRVGDTQ